MPSSHGYIVKHARPSTQRQIIAVSELRVLPTTDREFPTPNQKAQPPNETTFSATAFRLKSWFQKMMASNSRFAAYYYRAHFLIEFGKS